MFIQINDREQINLDLTDSITLYSMDTGDCKGKYYFSFYKISSKIYITTGKSKIFDTKEEAWEWLDEEKRKVKKSRFYF